MLNYQTLLSAYDDKLTLMQWLKKVEAALKDASAVSFNVNKRGNATITFSVVFEDGSELESNPIILQQGESVQAATIRNGHLILTLTNGDELDAGDLGGVSGFIIDASQHLIVTYQNGTTQDLGAIFTGNVTISGNLSVSGTISGKTPVLTADEDEISAQKPVVEVMNGYAFTIGGSSTHTFENVYASVVKNGNKLTFVVALESTRNEAGDDNMLLGHFTIPSSIGAKLFPYLSNYISIQRAQVFSTSTNSIEVINSIDKVSNSQINVLCRTLANDVNGTKYYIRVEATFLLSENLAA